MALKSCINCNKSISDYASKCIHCGNPILKNNDCIQLVVVPPINPDISEEEVISENTTSEEITQTMNKMNWEDESVISFVILNKDNNEHMEVSGNTSDGFSCCYKEKGQQYITSIAPKSIDHISEILLSYYNGNDKFKEENKFEAL